MALSITVTNPYTKQLQVVYAVIDRLAVSKQQKLANVVVDIYSSREARDANALPLYQLDFQATAADFDGWFAKLSDSAKTDSAFALAYKYAKSLPAFATSQDV